MLMEVMNKLNILFLIIFCNVSISDNSNIWSIQQTKYKQITYILSSAEESGKVFFHKLCDFMENKLKSKFSFLLRKIILRI